MISDVTGVDRALNTPRPGPDASPETLEYDAFLKLMTVQLENQDPLNPMDSADYVAQLATFSVVEQSIQTNDKLDQIISALERSSQADE